MKKYTLIFSNCLKEGQSLSVHIFHNENTSVPQTCYFDVDCVEHNRDRSYLQNLDMKVPHCPQWSWGFVFLHIKTSSAFSGSSDSMSLKSFCMCVSTTWVFAVVLAKELTLIFKSWHRYICVALFAFLCLFNTWGLISNLQILTTLS